VRLFEPLISRTDGPPADQYPAMSFDQWVQFTVGGNSYRLPVDTTLPGQQAEPIGNSFEGYAAGGLFGNGVIFGLVSKRVEVFSQARFQFQNFNKGRPSTFFGGPDLGILERPWPGGTTADLLALMLLHVDLAGNSYVTTLDGQLVVMRPDWVDILLRERIYVDPSGATSGVVGWEKAGYAYYHGGKGQTSRPVLFLPDEVAHFIDKPDPLASYRGMSWLTPVVREIQTDSELTRYKLRYLENSATPNLAVSLAKEVTPEQFSKFVELMDAKHEGVDKAGKTLYTGGGADVTVIGASLKDLDLKSVQGAGETRLAQAAGVPPVVADMSEGMQGSSLNAGNFGQARRKFADTTLAHLWGAVAGSLEVLVPAPQSGTRLWTDSRDIPFLHEDQKDRAEILATQLNAIEAGVRAGYVPDTVVAAVDANDLTLLEHTGLFSVQLQPPMTEQQQADATGDVAAEPSPDDEVADEPATV